MSLSSDIVLMSSHDDFMGWSRTQALGNWAALGPAVRDARTRAGLTQAALAEQAGVSRGWLIRFEAGLPNAEPVTAFRVLRALELELTLSAPTRTEERYNDLGHPDAPGSRLAVVDLDAILADLDSPMAGNVDKDRS